MPKQTNEEKLKDQVAQLKLELADVKEANRHQNETIKMLADKKEEYRQNFFRVCNALQTVQMSVTMVTGALAIDNISLAYETQTEFTTEPKS